MSQEPDRERHTERWLVPAVLLVFCGAAYWMTTTFRTMPPILKRGIQPSDFPQLVIGLIVVLTLLMAWRDPVRVASRLSPVVVGSIGLMGVFAVLTTVDFILALAVFAASLAVYWGERRWIVVALVGLAVPVVVFVLFDQVFEIRFPRGLLTDLWYG